MQSKINPNKKDYIRETLAFKELTPEEKQARGILGRLYGPCASFFDPTRNERFYNDDLWEHVFNEDEIVKEMFENGGIPMELDHPEAERDETKSLNIAAILPEKPKKDENGHLIAYVDILDTPAGRIAYTLAKYGFKWGISSRGSGDLYTDDNGNEAVDPSTYEFQTFDLVLLPALKDARLSMTESFNTEKRKMKKVRKVLSEAYNSYTEEEQVIMKENLDKLNIKLTEDADTNYKPVYKDGIEIQQICVDDLIDESMNEDLSEDDEYLANAREYADKIENNMSVEDAKNLYYNDYKFDKTPAADEAEEYIQAALEHKLGLTVVESLNEAKDEDGTEEEQGDMTVSDVVDVFSDLDGNKFIEFETVEIDGIEYTTDVVVSEETDDAVALKVVLTPVEDEDIEEADDSVDDEDVEADEDAANDDGADEVVENMKNLVRQVKMLEKKLKSLSSEKTVSDTKVETLEKELKKYKEGFSRTSELAAKSVTANKTTKSLQAELVEKQKEIVALNEKLSSQTKINESLAKKQTTSTKDSEKVKVLTEKLDTVNKELISSKEQFNVQIAQKNKKLNETVEIAKQYKAGYIKIMQKFIESKAKMLGIKSVEITNKLPAKYTLEDVEAVCTKIINESIGVSSLPFGKQTKIKINESSEQAKARAKAEEKRAMEESGFDVFDFWS